MRTLKSPSLRQDARRLSGAHPGGGLAQQPRPGGQARRTPPVPLHAGGSGGWAISERASTLDAGGRPDARAIQRMSPVWQRTTRSIHAWHLPTAPGTRPAANQRRRGEACDDEPVARGTCLPQHLWNPDHPIGALIETTIDARDADPVAPTAAPIYLERRCPFVMTDNVPGGDDRNRQNLGVGDTCLPITVPPQAFHQGVHHDHIRDVGSRQLAIKVCCNLSRLIRRSTLPTISMV